MGYFKSIRRSIGSYMPSTAQAQGQASNDQHSTPPGPSSSKKRHSRLNAKSLSPTPGPARKNDRILRVRGGRVAKSSAQSSSKNSSGRTKFWGLKYFSGFISQKNSGGVEVKVEEDELEGDTLLADLPTAQPPADHFEGDTLWEDAPIKEEGYVLEHDKLLAGVPTTQVPNIAQHNKLEVGALQEDVPTAKSVSIESDIIDGEDEELGTQLDEEQEDYEGWTEDEIWISEKLNMRGFEPLLHLTWALDFPTLIPELYTTDDSKVFINAVSGNFCQACRVLEGLNLLAARVRDRAFYTKLPPEPIIYREIKSYYNWSMKDAGLAHIKHIPVVAIVAARPNETVTSVVERLTEKLEEQGRQYRAQWGFDEASHDQSREFRYELPTLYGIVIKYTVISFITYDAANPDRPVKSLALFDFQHKGQDVWHGLAIAILLIHARNYLLHLKERGELGGEISKIDESSDDDPDV